MKPQTLGWTLLMVVGGAFLIGRAVLTGAGTVYVQDVEIEVEIEDEAEVEAQVVTLQRVEQVPPNARSEPGVRLSYVHTFGLWVAAACTLGIFSFLWGDNPLYKVTEAIFVGSSAAYAMVVAFWSELVQNLCGNLLPDLMRETLIPGLKVEEPNLWYLVPLVMAIMLLWRLMPSGGWISRWPLAFFIGATAGFRMMGYLEADFTQQISNTIMPLVVTGADGSFQFWASLKNMTIVGSVLVCLTYFFFSVEHTGPVGWAARLGIWVLMITFGASFGYTVMGRIALLAGRLEFLFDDWLWLIDPLGRRLDM